MIFKKGLLLILILISSASIYAKKKPSITKAEDTEQEKLEKEKIIIKEFIENSMSRYRNLIEESLLNLKESIWIGYLNKDIRVTTVADKPLMVIIFSNHAISDKGKYVSISTYLKEQDFAFSWTSDYKVYEDNSVFIGNKGAEQVFDLLVLNPGTMILKQDASMIFHKIM